LIKHDQARKITLATVQSNAGQQILARFGMPQDHFDTMMYLEGDTLYTQSEAFFKVMAQLPMPWPVLCVFRIIPLTIRNWMYDRIALNRYALFGKYDQCLLPNKDHQARFLPDD
jgi:predicted DCC family thiol-disulfide oxidoreductase YuxK